MHAGGTVVFIDAEHALDSAYAKAIGVDMTKLYLAQPDNGEQGADERARHAAAAFPRAAPARVGMKSKG